MIFVIAFTFIYLVKNETKKGGKKKKLYGFRIDPEIDSNTY